jgi:carboxymethylenebutenolidase
MKHDIEIKTKDGTAKAAVIKPANGAATDKGVILYMDAFGPREALYWMGQRIADAGYTVLVPDLFYRSAPTARSMRRRPSAKKPPGRS